MIKYSLLLTCFYSFVLFGCQIECVENTEANNCQTNCSKSPQDGPCYAAIPKYYFNREKMRCDTFIWGGCNGVVPFETLDACNSCDCK